MIYMISLELVEKRHISLNLIQSEKISSFQFVLLLLCVSCCIIEKVDLKSSEMEMMLWNKYKLYTLPPV